MLIIETLLALHKTIKQWKQKNRRIAIIPTMGNLHQGHMSLIDAGLAHSDKIIVSIFVNPTQFNCVEDYTLYPRTLKEDIKQLSCKKVDAVFTPKTEIIYPSGNTNHTFVDVPRFSNILEGRIRPGYFRGVATIISKLFNVIQPDIACFGEKDFQQLVLIRQLIQDMGYSTSIISVPIVRDTDGLALSSRNSHFSSEERRLAPKLNQILTQIKERIQLGEHYIDSLVLAEQQLLQSGLIPEILVIRDAETLQPLQVGNCRAVALASVWLGRVRLIDNVRIDFTLTTSTQ